MNGINVIISNKFQALLANLDIDVIKHISGEYTIDDLVTEFTNFYYNKMIIDITAIKNYENINVIQALSVNFDASKIILLLDDSEKVNSPLYLSQLVSMGIYNFTKSPDTIKFLIDNPNSYKDVARYHQLNAVPEKESLNDKKYDNTRGFIGQRVIGFKNVTDGAGSTTLVYMLKRHLEKNYKVKAVEVNSNDFSLFGDKSLDSISSMQLADYINENSDAEVILVDFNGEPDETLKEVIYLIEPGLTKLNKMYLQDKHIFEKLQDKKIVLNRSVLSDKDIVDFEKESGSKVFFNIPNLDDKLNNHEILNNFLQTLGFSRIGDENTRGLFSVFK